MVTDNDRYNNVAAGANIFFKMGPPSRWISGVIANNDAGVSVMPLGVFNTVEGAEENGTIVLEAPTVCPLPDFDVTFTDIMNGSSSADTTTDATTAGQLTTASSMSDLPTCIESESAAKFV